MSQRRRTQQQGTQHAAGTQPNMVSQLSQLSQLQLQVPSNSVQRLGPLALMGRSQHLLNDAGLVHKLLLEAAELFSDLNDADQVPWPPAWQRMIGAAHDLISILDED